MEEIKAWRTNDDQIFSDEEKAKKHEVSILFYQWFQNNQIYKNFKIEFDDLVHLLEEHKIPLMDFLNHL